jgi:hypothetical protein
VSSTWVREGAERRRLDAFAARTAAASLATLNRRHFPMLATVLVPYAKGGASRGAVMMTAIAPTGGQRHVPPRPAADRWR